MNAASSTGSFVLLEEASDELKKLFMVRKEGWYVTAMLFEPLDIAILEVA